MKKEKYTREDYKKIRDEAIEAAVVFRKLGDTEMAEEYLNLATRINNIRVHIDPVKIVNKEN